MEDLTVEDVARELRMTTESIRRFLRDGSLKGYQPGGRKWLVTRTDLDAFKGRARRANRAPKGHGVSND